MPSYFPLFYEQINQVTGCYTPSSVKSRNNKTFRFWERGLFQRACSTLDITMPEDWKKNKDLLYFCLFAYGYVGCGDVPELGKWFNPGTLSGFDFYYRPVKFLLANPNYKGRKNEFVIGKECEIIKLTPDYMGIWDIIAYYAEKLATIDVAINTAIINSKFAYIVGAKNKAAAAVLKKLFDRVNSGEPAVFFDEKLANDATDKEEPWQVLFRDNLKQSYIVTDLLRDFQTLINDFDTEIGIPTLPYEKKERLVTSEAESKQIDATSRSIIWFETLKDSFERANKFLGLTGSDKLSVKLRYDQEGGEDELRKDNPVGNAAVDAGKQ
jgi:hypothetical protein